MFRLQALNCFAWGHVLLRRVGGFGFEAWGLQPSVLVKGSIGLEA